MGPGPPVMGTVVSPDPVSDMGPDPDPVIGIGVSPDPEPVGTGGMVVATAQLHCEIVPLPFLILTVKEHPPTSTTPVPEHILSQLDLPEQAAPSLMMKVQVHFAFPSFTFWFVYLACKSFSFIY